MIDLGVIRSPVELLQAEAAGPERGLDGDVQRGVGCVVSAGSVCGLQTKRGAPLLTLSGIRKPSPEAPHGEA